MSKSAEQASHSESPEVQIRHARPDDRGFVRELAVRVFSVYGSYGQYLIEWFDAAGVSTLVAETGVERVGLAMLAVATHRKPGEAVAELLAIAVEPRFQSQGVGRLLLERAIAEASQLPSSGPIRELHLSVAEGNARAQRLFGRRGFRLAGGEGIYPAGQRALHMVKAL